MEFIPHVHQIRDLFVNVYLIVEQDGLTLIDAGIGRRGGRILRYIAGLGRAPADLQRIIITHADGDHVAGAAALKSLSGARIFANPIEARAMAAGKGSRDSRETKRGGLMGALVGLGNRFMKSPAVQADELLEDGQLLPVLGGMRVVATPGHTPGHTSLFVPSVGVLFSGDSLIARHGMLKLSPYNLSASMAQAAESAHEQAALGAKIVCPGHGDVVMDAAGKFPA